MKALNIHVQLPFSNTGVPYNIALSMVGLGQMSRLNACCITIQQLILKYIWSTRLTRGLGKWVIKTGIVDEHVCHQEEVGNNGCYGI